MRIKAAGDHANTGADENTMMMGGSVSHHYKGVDHLQVPAQTAVYR